MHAPSGSAIIKLSEGHLTGTVMKPTSRQCIGDGISLAVSKKGDAEIAQVGGAPAPDASPVQSMCTGSFSGVTTPRCVHCGHSDDGRLHQLHDSICNATFHPEVVVDGIA